MVAAAVAVSALGGWWLGGVAADDIVTVIDVIDGDTIVVARPSGAQDTVRLLGVDTPETHHPDRPVECFGPEASDFSRSVLLGRTVRLERDVEARDVYGRLLAYVYVSGGLYNAEVLARGYARLLVIAPNLRHGRALLAAEQSARDARAGLWGSCRE